MTIKLGSHCLVCGFDMGMEITDGAWQDDCSCCGCQIGYTYTTNNRPQDIDAVKYCRQDWANSGYKWADGEEYQPKGWNKEMALKQIKDNVPEEFQ